MQKLPAIVENYRDYTPPFAVDAVVERLLRHVPDRYLTGLHAIVLTNKGSLSHTRRRSTTVARKRKVKLADVRGLYHARWGNEPAWIEIFVDALLEPQRSRWMKLALVRDFAVAEVLYHELGHHVHYTAAPEFREREDVARDWCNRFMALHVRHYWWARFARPLLRPVIYVLKWWHGHTG